MSHPVLVSERLWLHKALVACWKDMLFADFAECFPTLMSELFAFLAIGIGHRA
jgi:hypothetical protein